MQTTITRLILRSRLLALPRKVVGTLIRSLLASKQEMAISYKSARKAGAIALIQKVKKETDFLMADYEAFHIYSAVQKTAKVPGDIAEVGTYCGGSAKVICEAMGAKQLHTFDTFEGLPEITAIDDPAQFHKGEFSASFESVKKYLSAYSGAHIYKGLFPASSGPIKDKMFSFVHLDVDLHLPTRESLEFFYPRMSKGAVLISHDYGNAEGVRKAVDDFFADKPEPVFEYLAGNQCMIVKL
jgi:O-methyltransferase